MLAKTSVGDVYLRFHHTADPQRIVELAEMYMPPDRFEVWLTTYTAIKFATLCEVAVGSEVYAGASFCSEKDVLDRSQGRKRAMARAFSKSPLSKAVRQEIWDVYFEKTNAFANVSLTVPAKLYEELEKLAVTLETDVVGSLSAMLESCRVVNDVSLAEVEATVDKPEEVKADDQTQATATS